MLFTRWLRNLRGALAPRPGDRNRRRRSLRAATHRPRLELLEDRCTPSFSPAVLYSAGDNPQAVLTADFNGDGRLDLAVANISSTVSVLLGNADVLGIADGTFQTAQSSPTGANPRSLAVGDFNEDGKLDLATANAADVSVLLGNGDGTFQAPINIGFTESPASVAVGDFNGDGRMDLGVTSNVYTSGYSGYYGSYPGYYSGYVAVLLGTGTGSFGAQNTTALGYGYHTSATAAYLNGDGFEDFATINLYYGTVSVLLGDSLGYLNGHSSYYTGNSPSAVAAGDVNGDLKTDLVVANRNGNDVSVLLGVGDGGFGAAQNFAVGSEPTSVVLGDFTGDGQIDIATANYSSSDVSVLYGIGNGTFTAAVNSATGSYPLALAAGDFNGGSPDAATVNADGVSVLINDQSWPSPPPPSISIGDVTVAEGNGGTTSATFTLTLSAAFTQDVTVHYTTADGSATAGSDFTATSGDVTFTPGQLSRTVTVAVIGDRLAESTETFAVNLSAPVNATIGDDQGIGTILDDEPLISIDDVAVTEGNTGSVNATFTVTLTAVSDVDVTVHYATANGSATASDYTAASGDVIILAGELSGTFTIAVTGDRLPEPTETFVVNLSAPVNAGVADGQGVGTILDNEPRISIGDVSKAEGKNRKTTLFTFTVTLATAYDQAVTMSYGTVDGTATSGSGDYVAKTGTLTFAPGETTKTITIEVKGDNKREANETFYLDLYGLSINGLFTKNRGIGTILNDDR